MPNEELPRYDRYESIDTKYARTIINVNINSTPKRSHAANAAVWEIAACKFPWYPGTVTLFFFLLFERKIIIRKN